MLHGFLLGFPLIVYCGILKEVGRLRKEARKVSKEGKKEGLTVKLINVIN